MSIRLRAHFWVDNHDHLQLRVVGKACGPSLQGHQILAAVLVFVIADVGCRLVDIEDAELPIGIGIKHLKVVGHVLRCVLSDLLQIVWIRKARPNKHDVERVVKGLSKLVRDGAACVAEVAGAVAAGVAAAAVRIRGTGLPGRCRRQGAVCVEGHLASPVGAPGAAARGAVLAGARLTKAAEVPVPFGIALSGGGGGGGGGWGR